MAPSTFASAAAGANSNNARPDTNEWQRRPNGATLTMRRPSSATNSQAAQRDPPSSAGVYVPPHMSRNGATDLRYTKEELLALYGGQRDGDARDASSLFMPGWDPSEGQDGAPAGADVCWDRGGHVRPMGLTELSAEERELFAGTVNSPLKPPTQPGGKEAGNREGLSGRKTSVSHGQNGPDKYGVSSPTSGRPSNRRREPGDAYPFPSTSNPSLGSRLSKEDSAAPSPPPSVLRRRTDYKESGEEKDHGSADVSSPLSGFKRAPGGVIAGGAPGSGLPWAAASPGTAFSGMGSFGSFGIGGSAQPAGGDKRPGYGSMRGESRFKGMMKDSADDGGRDDEARGGSAVLVDESSPHEASTSRGDGRGAPGMASLDDVGFSHLETPAKQRISEGAHEPMSPTNTNPYQSPDHERTEHDDTTANGSDIHHSRLAGFAEFGGDPTMSTLPGLGTMGGFGRANLDPAGSDRSQTSSVGPSRGFPNLGGLGGLPGLGGPSPWHAPGAATPSKERAGFGPFGDGMFGSMADLQSPALAGLGSSSGLGPGVAPGGTIGRAGKIGSLFPQALQDQMRVNDIPKPGEEHIEGGPSAFGSIGQTGFGLSGQAPDSPIRAARSFFDEIPGIRPDGQMPGDRPFTSGLQQPGTASAALPPPLGLPRGPGPQSGQPATSPPTNQPPPAQQRTMVMPDRMRWIYKDPQGNTQGPWSGLEMHEWYKAGYFTAELLVKKAEDPDYEPLASLIRRIGNSREPFLVPQIGIPHGPPTGHYAGGTGGSVGTQPPFANSFPSFGTTLTAEQQNALERRKQEEQYLMARQKEHLAQQQLMAKQMMGPSGVLPQQLHHHNSAHSLQSQPSFGSITSPTGYQPSPTQGPPPGAPGAGPFDAMFRAPGSAAATAAIPPIGSGPDAHRPSEVSMMERLSIGRGQPGPNQWHQLQSDIHAQQAAAIANERVRLQREQSEFDASQQRSGQASQQAALLSYDRLQEFHELRKQVEKEQNLSGEAFDSHDEQQHLAHQAKLDESAQNQVAFREEYHAGEAPENILSLSEQVQKAASAKQTPTVQSPGHRTEPSAPVPPPQSSSPMPAPVAQRKQNVAETLHAESRSQNQTPSVDTPSASVAPWAKDVVEPIKGPSLKEIQEAEARKAAQQEEIAAASRRAALEKELLAQQSLTSTAQAPGLPSSSTWGNAQPAPTQPAAVPPWAKPTVAKVATPSTAPKKTLQQIQKEEEARKRAAVVASATNTASPSSPSPALSTGKRYADLASKNVQAGAAGAAAAGSGAWTTVGAGGKAKLPVATPTAPAAIRSTSTANVAATRPKPVTIVSRSATAGPVSSGPLNAQEEFKKWSVGELRHDLNKGINVDDFVQTLLSLPPEMDVITEAVHSVSQTMDSRHFAEEFLRSSKLAAKGIVEAGTASPSASAQGGGWSEVAKKGGSSGSAGNVAGAAAREEPNSFRVVAAKKKGGKR